MGTGGQEKSGRRETEAGAGERVRHPVSKIQPTGHPELPKEMGGNRCTWEGKKREAKKFLSPTDISL